MATFRESLGFTYNGIHSSEFGILNVKTDAGLFEESFMPNRSIIEEKSFGRDEPYFFGFDYSPAEIPLQIYFNDGWDEQSIHEITNWLSQPNYQPLIFDNDVTRIFYCAYVGDPSILHNGLSEGYANITMRCNSPFSYTPIYTNEYNFTGNTLGTEIELYNIGHKEAYPVIEIEKIGDGDISIINLSDDNKETKLIAILDGEVVRIDGNHDEVETNLPNTYRYGNFNNKFLKLVTGVNDLKITGDANITFSYQFKRFI